MRFAASFAAFFIVCFFVSYGVAAAIIGPMIAPGFGDLMRGADDMSGFGPMVLGFAVYSLAGAWLVMKARAAEGWLMNGLLVGLALNVVIIGQYAILPGWSVLPAGPSIWSGVVSGLPSIPAAIAAAFAAARLSGGKQE